MTGKGPKIQRNISLLSQFWAGPNPCLDRLCKTANELHLPLPECILLCTKVEASIPDEKENKDEGSILAGENE